MSSLKERRVALRKREDHVEKLLREGKLDERHILAELEAEREEREQLGKRRKELTEALEAEIRRDEKDRGKHPEQWEDWADSRRDELADLVEASEARIDRLIERAANERKLLADLERRDRKLEGRIKRITKRIADSQQSSGQLSKDFHVAEFGCRDGTPVPAGIVPHLKALCVAHLQPLRDSGGSVHINSGYRTRSYNAAIGGATASYHIYDLRMRAPAADHVQAGRSAPLVQNWHDGHNAPDGMGYYGGFTHIDDRGYRSRWWGAA